MSRISTEKKTLTVMFQLYCDGLGQQDGALCPDCTSTLSYALQRLDHCPFGNEKPTCKNCTVHCFKPEMRDKIRMVMRSSGPRMILHSPRLALLHLIQNKKSHGKQFFRNSESI